jgi:hypothetical protein
MKSPKKKTHLTVNPTLIVLIVILCNLILLDIFFIHNMLHGSVLGTTTESTAAACPRSCIDQFSQFVSSGSQAAREYFVPLGAGSSTAGDWTNISGAQSYIDSLQYRRIKKVVFEVTVQVPTGNQTVSVRLFNATDRHPVWFSDVFMDGAGPVLLTSSPITLDSGNKLYQVQAKTQLGYPANVSQSRIHITTY